LASSKHKSTTTVILAKNEETKKVSIQDNSSQKTETRTKLETQELKMSEELSTIPETSIPKYFPTIASNDESFISTENTDVVISKVKADVVKQVVLIEQSPKIDI